MTRAGLLRQSTFYGKLHTETPICPSMWQAEADTELTLSASSTTAVGQKALALAKRRYSTVIGLEDYGFSDKNSDFTLLGLNNFFDIE